MKINPPVLLTTLDLPASALKYEALAFSGPSQYNDSAQLSQAMCTTTGRHVLRRATVRCKQIFKYLSLSPLALAGHAALCPGLSYNMQTQSSNVLRLSFPKLQGSFASPTVFMDPDLPDCLCDDIMPSILALTTALVAT